jgi:uncharacterized membrane protein YidH (DUF202 family)
VTAADPNVQRDVPDDDELPGLAGERTDLAWSRSGLALLVAGGAIARRIWLEVGTATGRVVIFTLLGLGAVVCVSAMWWARLAARSTIEGRLVTDRGPLRRVTVGTLLFAAAALVMAMLPAAG